ncbi:nuclear transport factor 2 family protein [Ktedonosporobacter rubrisoli]|uniref:Nuclear transport factor 2 family protein n=1 Tax=Ktedonosporobacter rubrisoli TaxID=2509675 RepID=A0A4P6JQR0_KTERU|nr:nuclear transport factor 2 family protein [Ktedonosporobacter rubrisoli]QBD77492.1 nuclear transport factor 2 family protein [Ktedonosporobacter rubrisoli]
MISQEVIKDTISAYFAANRAMDVEGFVAMFAQDAAIYNAGEVSPLVGLEAVRQVAIQSIIPFSKMEIEIKRMFTVGNGAAVFYSGAMTAKNGRSANVEGIDVFEINEQGKIQSIRFYIDLAAIVALF